MASIASAGIGTLAPLAAAAGLAFYVAMLPNKPAEAPHRRNRSDDERRREQAVGDMEWWGTSASFWQANDNKKMQLGSIMNKELSLNPRYQGEKADPNQNPFSRMHQDHADLAQFDAQDTLLSLSAHKGTIRMNKTLAIPTTLTPDLVNQRHPHHIAVFDGHHERPEWANAAQQKEAERLVAADIDPDNRMRSHYGVAMFNRAHGQSFRYEE